MVLLNETSLTKEQYVGPFHSFMGRNVSTADCVHACMRTLAPCFPCIAPYRIQTLTFHLCHTYASATRSVSIPAPVYCEHHPLALHSMHLVASIFTFTYSLTHSHTFALIQMQTYVVRLLARLLFGC